MSIMSKYTSRITTILWYALVSGPLQAVSNPAKCQDKMEFSNLLDIGARYDAIGNVNDAITCLRIATETKPSSAQAWIHFSDLLIRAGKYSQASDVLTGALRAFLSARKNRESHTEEISDLESALARSLEAQGLDNEAEVKRVVRNTWPVSLKYFRT